MHIVCQTTELCCMQRRRRQRQRRRRQHGLVRACDAGSGWLVYGLRELDRN